MIPTLRAPLEGSGERQLITEASCHARQPQGPWHVGASPGHVVPWRAWAAMYAPACWEAQNEGRACVAELDGVVVGFAVVATGNKLFMLYVKKEYRGNGWGRLLLEHLLPEQWAAKAIETTADMLTPSWGAWCRRHGLTTVLPR